MWKHVEMPSSRQLDQHMDPERGGQSLEDHGGCTQLGSGFSVNSWCDLGHEGQFLHGRVLLWWHRTFSSIHWLRCLSQLESVWLRKEPETCHSGLELCVTWQTATTCREQCLASYVAGDPWAEQGGLRSVFVLLKSQRRVQHAHGRVLSKISWGRDHLYKMLSGAKEDGAPVSDVAVDTSLIWVIRA